MGPKFWSSRIGGGDREALPELFTRLRKRLRRMVRLRLDQRLQGRVDPEALLDEAYHDVLQHAREYFARPECLAVRLAQATYRPPAL